MIPHLDSVYYGNSVQTWLSALLLLTIGWGLLITFHILVLGKLRRWAESTDTPLDDLLVRAVRRTLMPLAYVSVLLAAIKSLTLPSILDKALAWLWAGTIMLAVVRAILGAVRHTLEEIWLKHHPQRAVLLRQVNTVWPIVSLLVWSVALLIVLDNFGFKVTAVMAGLGIGGVAVALAAQAVLGDLFGYFSIMFDKPFEVDDFIIVGDLMGTVEYIGIKTTRLRSLSGEQLVFSNKDLTDSRIRNFKRMQERRIVFKLGVTYDTPTDRLKTAVALVKDAILHAPQTRFDRAHFAAFGDSSLGIEAVYFVLSADYNVFMDVQQKINFEIKDAFAKAGIAFAFPTQTIQLSR